MDIQGLKKRAKAVGAAASAVDAFERARMRTPLSLAALIATGERALRALDGAKGIEALLDGARSEVEKALQEAKIALERERALLAGEIAMGLKEKGFDVTGNLPRLYAPPFTLEFDFGAKGKVVIWFGPKKERLLAVPLEVEEIVKKVAELHDRLFPPDFDEASFLALLERAYRLCTVRLGLREGERVPITALMAEAAFLRQGKAFFSDPRRENFASFGRVEFASALSRLETLRTPNGEFRFDVATIAQTKQPQDHLWVPRGRSIEGVNLATASFIRRPQKEGVS